MNIKIIETHRCLSYYRANSMQGSIQDFNLEAKIICWPEADNTSILTLSNMFSGITLDKTFYPKLERSNFSPVTGWCLLCSPWQPVLHTYSRISAATVAALTKWVYKMCSDQYKHYCIRNQVKKEVTWVLSKKIWCWKQ